MSRIAKACVFVFGVFAVIGLRAQDAPGLALAKRIDQEILKLNDLPDPAASRAIADLALRIRQQPPRYRTALAFNLAVAASDAIGRDALQEVATTLAVALRAPAGDKSDDAYRKLAELERYCHVRVSLDDPKYRAAMVKLEDDDRSRDKSDFTLTDVQGRKWNLKNQRGRVVLVNFWATWCPPCRQELPDLEALCTRFRDRGLVILSISDEDLSILRPFVSQQKVNYPVLLDPGQKVKKLFRVLGIPKSFVYNREGHLVAQAIDRPNMQGFLAMLSDAGLRP